MRIAPYVLATRYVLGAVLATGAILATSACTTGVSTVGQQHPIFRTAHSNLAMNGRDVLVIVQGGGYGAEQNSFRQSVLDNMQRSRAGLKTNFTATPQNNPNTDYKVVMLFNGPSSVQAAELCRQPEKFAAVAPRAGGDTHVLAAFCRFDAPLTEVSGQANGVTTLADARFASLIRQTVSELFPSGDSRSQRDSGKAQSGNLP